MSPRFHVEEGVDATIVTINHGANPWVSWQLIWVPFIFLHLQRKPILRAFAGVWPTQPEYQLVWFFGGLLCFICFFVLLDRTQRFSRHFFPFLTHQFQVRAHSVIYRVLQTTDSANSPYTHHQTKDSPTVWRQPRPQIVLPYEEIVSISIVEKGLEFLRVDGTMERFTFQAVKTEELQLLYDAIRSRCENHRTEEPLDRAAKKAVKHLLQQKTVLAHTRRS